MVMPLNRYCSKEMETKRLPTTYSAACLHITELAED